MTKEQIRREMKIKRGSLTKEERMLFDSNLLERFRRLPEYIECNHLFAYVSFGTEPDTHQLIFKALQDGKTVYVPRVEGATMEYYQIHALEGFETSGFGIPEPQPGKDIRYQRNAYGLMLMPGLAFALQGGRIGFGAGYFDKYLADFPPEQFLKVALAYDFQVMDQLETEPYDIGTDIILTPVRTIYCNSF